MPENPDIYRGMYPRPMVGKSVGSPETAGGPSYVELVCRSNFSFLRGASHPEELVERAGELGYAALAVTDRNTLAGVVRMHVAAKARGLRLVVGAEIVPSDAGPITLYPTGRPAYGRLCRLITRGRLRTPKGECEIHFDDVADLSAGLVGVVLEQKDGPAGVSLPPDDVDLRRYREVFGDRLYLAAGALRGGDDEAHLERAHVLSKRVGVPMVATNDVHYHEPGRRFLQDVLTCIRQHCTLEQAGTRLFANAERYLKTREQMGQLFAEYPGALARTVEVASRCRFSLDELRYEYPEELCPRGALPGPYLARLTWAGAKERYPGGIPDKVRRLIEHELRLIAELQYEPYFLTVWDIVRFARSRNILCQGRGSAANSAVCYCLGITSVDPERIDLLFERFVSRERDEPPDIDVDFEHERREEVFQYIYNKYTRERAGIVAEVITYRPRSAVRDVGKALGLSLDRVDAIAKSLSWWDDEPLPEDRLRQAGIDPQERTVRCLVGLVKQIMGFPRHLSQHVGGFVITRGPLCEMVPLENGAMPGRTFIEWDKDDIDALGILKIDCLSLGMLTAIRKCFEFVNNSELELRIENLEWRTKKAKTRLGGEQGGVPHPSFSILNSQFSILNSSLALHTVPAEDPAVYDMICAADTVGVFQIESRAQMSMLPRLRPRCYYDLVIEVAIVRPGPIQGQMVHPYLRRRKGEETVTYPTAGIEAVLRKTLGVPLFQEQVMQLAVVAAGFTPGEADQLRRAMGAWRRSGEIEKFRTRLLEGMRRQGVGEEFAQRVFEQIQGFGSYGFPESHAASFALLVYASAWLKRYHPAAFCAAVINSQPMGFYAPAQLVQDARRHGVEVRPIDVNYSAYDCTLEGPRPDDQVVPHVGGAELERLSAALVCAPPYLRRDGAPERVLSGGGMGPQQADPCEHPADIFEHRSASGGPMPHMRQALNTHATKSRARRPSGALAAASWGANGPALRLGIRLIKGISRDKVEGIGRARRAGRFTSVADLARRSGSPASVLARLAAADAFRSLGLNRREALWQVLALGADDTLWHDSEPSLLAGLEVEEPRPSLPPLSAKDVVVQDYATTGLSLALHPMSLLRRQLKALGAIEAATLKRMPAGRRVRLGGLVLVRQRPGTAKGITFMTLEDETGLANLIVRPQVYERCRAEAYNSVAVWAEGRVERQGEVIHIQTELLRDLSRSLDELPVRSRDFH